MNAVLDDLRHAWRGLRNHLGTSLFAIVTLACGMAAALAILCVVDAVLLRALPYPNAERIVQLRELDENGRPMAFAMPNYVDLSSGNDALAAASYYNWATSTIGDGRQVVRQTTATTGGDFFRIFGSAPLQGRTYAAGERDPVVVISHGLWQGLFQGRADVIGQRIRVGDDTRSVIGVMPPGFGFPEQTSAWIPNSNDSPATSRTAHNYEALALLRSPSELAGVRLAANTLAQRLVQQYGKDIDAHGFDVVPLATALAAPVRSGLLMLAGGTAFLLLIAISNVINLLLALNAARAREFAVRSAMGASAWRMARQTWFEALGISASATLLGLLAAAASIRLLVRMAGASLPRADEVGLSVGIVSTAFAAALLIAVLLTAASLLAARERRQPITALRENGRGQTASRSALRTRAGLLVAQTAFTTVLLVGAGLLGRSFIELMNVDPGFRSDGAISVQLSQPWTADVIQQQRNGERYSRLIDSLRGVAGVSVVGGVNDLPLAGNGANGAFWDGSVTDMEHVKPIGYSEFRVASDDFFKAAGIALLRGRVFDSSDRANGDHVAVISAAVAKATWGDRDPIGQRIQVGNMDGNLRPVTIVGIVGDVRERRLERAPMGSVYVNLAQRPAAAFNFDVVVRSELPLASLMPSLRSLLDQTSSELPYALRPLSELREQATAQRRFNLVLLGGFASVALLLAVGGLYGLMAFAVGQRRHEFALRQALGSSTRGILHLVLGSGLKVAIAGIVIGLIAALAGSRLIGSLLYGIPASDPLTLFAVSATLLLTLLIASLLPARQACTVNPRDALA